MVNETRIKSSALFALCFQHFLRRPGCAALKALAGSELQQWRQILRGQLALQASGGVAAVLLDMGIAKPAAEAAAPHQGS